VFVNPRPIDDDLTRLYLEKTPESQADFYAKTVSPAQIAEYQRILTELVDLLPGRGRLLDLGCAAGHFMQQSARKGFDAHGVDLATC
jgi:cyclopropane fatty-acyl-phospholipid synthase-like methyltransferase